MKIHFPKEVTLSGHLTLPALLIAVKMIRVMIKSNPFVEADSRVIIMDVPEQPLATRRRRRRVVNFLTEIHKSINKDFYKENKKHIKQKQ